MMGRYRDKVLFVDLYKRKTILNSLKKDFVKKFIGCRGFGAKIFYDVLKPHTDYLGPDNMLVMLSVLLTGIAAPRSKMSIVDKLPVTGSYADSVRWDERTEVSIRNKMKGAGVKGDR